jgi:hypothetical protein
VLVVLVTAATGVFAFWMTRGGVEGARSTTEQGPSTKVSALPTTLPATPPVTSLTANAASALSVASSSRKKTEAELWPEPLPNPAIRVSRDPSEGDPFESKQQRPSDVRELARVGGVRLGVTYASKLKDEVAVTAVLKEMGAEIDKAEQGRTDSYEARVVDYQKIFDRYRGRLAPIMEGSFATKSGDWTDTEPLVRPGGPAPSASR